MKIRTALAGLGRIAWEFHLPELARHPAFSLEAVADPLPERVADTRERFRVPRGYRSVAELLNAETPELVVIASPTCCHKEQILQAFDAGCDVFCDKPLALSAAEVREIAAAARNRNRKIMTYHFAVFSKKTVSAGSFWSAGSGRATSGGMTGRRSAPTAAEC